MSDVTKEVLTVSSIADVTRGAVSEKAVAMVKDILVTKLAYLCTHHVPT